MRTAAVQHAPQSTSIPQSGAVSFALNTRLSAHLSNALLKASTDRKLQRLNSSTQRDIVEEALAEWLQKNDYLS